MKAQRRRIYRIGESNGFAICSPMSIHCELSLNTISVSSAIKAVSIAHRIVRHIGQYCTIA
jgi:hypothetical protein